VPADTSLAAFRWSEKRFYRILVDYLARTGRSETARTLAHATHVEVRRLPFNRPCPPGRQG